MRRDHMMHKTKRLLGTRARHYTGRRHYMRYILEPAWHDMKCQCFDCVPPYWEI